MYCMQCGEKFNETAWRRLVKHRLNNVPTLARAGAVIPLTYTCERCCIRLENFLDSPPVFCYHCGRKLDETKKETEGNMARDGIFASPENDPDFPKKPA